MKSMTSRSVPCNKWRSDLGTISYWGKQTKPMGCLWTRRPGLFFVERFSGQVVCAYRIVKGLTLLFWGFKTTCADPWEAEVCWSPAQKQSLSCLIMPGQYTSFYQVCSGTETSSTHLTKITSVTLTQHLLVPICLKFWLHIQHSDFLAERYNPDVSTRRGRG